MNDKQRDVDYEIQFTNCRPGEVEKLRKGEYHVLGWDTYDRAHFPTEHKGNLEEMKAKATEEAEENIGTVYLVFPVDGEKSVYKVHYREVKVCPKCGEKVFIEA